MPDVKIFINARPRTGGTLLATMLHAHPSISMGYEMYPQLLEDASGKAYELSYLVQCLSTAENDDPQKWVRGMPQNSFKTFVARARRSGLEPETVLTVLRAAQSEGILFDELDGRLDFIDQLLFQQRQLHGKAIVGSKMRADLCTLLRRHPEATFLMMLRDGRDVLSSLKSKGSFNATVENCAHEWVNSLAEFQSFIDTEGVHGMIVKYEDLVAYPERELQSVLTLMDLEFDRTMLNFHLEYQPLFENAHGHLSAQQLTIGLSNESIGKWRKGALSDSEVKKFTMIAGECLEKYGYSD